MISAERLISLVETRFKKFHSYRVYILSRVLRVYDNTNNHYTYLHNVCNYDVTVEASFPGDIAMIATKTDRVFEMSKTHYRFRKAFKSR